MKPSPIEFSTARKTPVASGCDTNQIPVNGSSAWTERQPHQRWLTFAVCFFLAAIVWAVFGQTIHYEFVNYDDPAYVYGNPAITQGLNWQGIVWIFSHTNIGTWFPLTDISHQLDWQLHGSNAGGHHLTNVLLHAATAILLFLVLRKMTGMFWSAAFVAAVFAIHPLRVESVAWVVERKDVLSGLFFMLTLWTWVCYVQKRLKVENGELKSGSASSDFGPRHWTLGYYLALLFFALGLMSKSMLVTLPLILLLLDYWPLNRLPPGTIGFSRRWFQTWLGLILEKTPFFLLATAICVITVHVQKNAVFVAQNLTHFGRIGNALSAYTDYLGHMFYPVNLAVAYCHWETNPTIWIVGWSLLVLSGISAGVLAGARKHRYLVVGWLWYLVMFAPVIDIMQVGQNARADRYTYLPQIGLYVMMTWGVVELCAFWRHHRVVLGFVATAILASLLACAYIQTGYWKNSVSLWTHAVACRPSNAFAENNLGGALAAQGKWNGATEHYERAIQLEPDYPEAQVNLGIARVNQGKLDDAIQYFDRALQINPHSAEAHYNLGSTLTAQGKLPEAIQQLEQALECRPGYTDAHYGLGLTLGMQGKWDEAIPHLEQALQIKLDRTGAQYLLAVALAGQKKWNQAIELYQQVLQHNPDFAEAHNNLGIALASQGKLAEAAQHFQQALTLATAQGNTSLAGAMHTRLKSYQSALPQPQTP